jgi:cytochrome c-type biogenesis protein CcmH
MKIRIISKTVWIVILTFVIAGSWVSRGVALTVTEITKDLTCSCGCNMVVSACEGTMECSPARQITDQVTQLVNNGQTKDEILRYLIRTKGEQILAAPTKKGFNLTAWILPFLAIVFGGIGLFVFLKKCLSSGKIIADAPYLSGSDQGLEKKYSDQFERELKAFEQ